jgi:hypothetical protein
VRLRGFDESEGMEDALARSLVSRHILSDCALSLPEAPAWRRGLLVDGLYERAQCLALLLLVTHVVEGIQAPGDFDRPCLDFFIRHWECPAGGID